MRIGTFCSGINIAKLRQPGIGRCVIAQVRYERERLERMNAEAHGHIVDSRTAEVIEVYGEERSEGE